MDTSSIIESLDKEIARLQTIRAAVAGLQTAPEPRKPGRPKGVKNTSSAEKSAGGSAPKKRVMSAEGKARIAAAQKARWAKQHAAGTATRKSAGKKAAKKAAPAEE